VPAAAMFPIVSGTEESANKGIVLGEMREEFSAIEV
jgi:hypothetical protein